MTKDKKLLVKVLSLTSFYKRKDINLFYFPAKRFLLFNQRGKLGFLKINIFNPNYMVLDDAVLDGIIFFCFLASYFTHLHNKNA